MLSGCFSIFVQGDGLSAPARYRRVYCSTGVEHVLESGFVFDRNLGVPYLPGTSIKGMMRAYATQWRPGLDPATEDANAYATLFGDSVDQGAGAVIIHDAFPVSPQILDLDIMSVHFAEYYRARGTQPPVDTESPTILSFLVVRAGVRFVFGLSPRRGARAEPNLDLAQELLVDALATIGIGAKTAVGYGRFQPVATR